MLLKLFCKTLMYLSLLINNISATILTFDEIRELRDFIERIPEVGELNRIVQENSSAIVLIYSISSKVPTEPGKDMFYNIAAKPRTNELDYRYGVISGVIISSDGIVVTPYDCVKYADNFIISIDSEKRKNKTAGVVSLTKNDFNGKLIKAIPELGLAFLKIELPKSQASRKFDYLDVANDASITAGREKRYLLNGGIIYSKCKVETMAVSERNPGININSFGAYKLFCSRIASDIFEGLRRLTIYNPVLSEIVTPEFHGGALITLNAKLLGLAIYQRDISAPVSYAIPASIIKRGMQLATPWLIKLSDDSNLGIEVEPLNNAQKKQLVKLINSWDHSLYSNTVATFPHVINGKPFGKLQDEVKNGRCGVSVKTISEAGILSSAGIRQGDIILTLQNVGITSIECFRNLEAQSIGEYYVELQVVPLGQRIGKNETVMFVPIYRDINNHIKKNAEPEVSKRPDDAFNILDRIKLWINKMKKSK